MNVLLIRFCFLWLEFLGSAMNWLERYLELARSPPQGVEIAFLFLHVENFLAVQFWFDWQPKEYVVLAFFAWKFKTEKRAARRRRE